MKKQKQPSKALVKKKILDVLAATSGLADPKPGKHGCGMILSCYDSVPEGHLRRLCPSWRSRPVGRCRRP